MKKIFYIVLLLLSIFVLSSCEEEEIEVEKEPVFKTISKDEYYNKTLAGVLGQMAGFLSGYEFVWDGPDPRLGMPEEWFEFLNGPCAGNYTHFQPGAGSLEQNHNRYDRLRLNEATGRYEVYGDDDFHIDFFNQLILKEYGFSSYAIKTAWDTHKVSDWGGGEQAMRLINSYGLLSPFTGTMEAGNIYSWCTEAYIENETLGMDAPGMMNQTIDLIDTFAANVGYDEPIIWAKFYSSMYSIAYFENDVRVIMDYAKETMPKGSYPRYVYEESLKIYERYPNDYQSAAYEAALLLRPISGIDNIQTDPSVNGAFAILSLLYGQNDYLDTCKYASLLGYDADCTASIVTGLLGIIHGHKQDNEEYQLLNEKMYYDGEGLYVNDKITGYQTFISKDYPEKQKFTDIAKLYQENFENILLVNGGTITDTEYIIPTDYMNYKDDSLLFDNYDAEKRDLTGYETNSVKAEVIEESSCVNVHKGYASIKATNESDDSSGQIYHTFNKLKKGKYYRVSIYVQTNSQMKLFASTKKGNDYQYITFANSDKFINKTFIFKATDKTMRVGFEFGKNAKSDSFIIFDDFYIEEVENEVISIHNVSTRMNRYTKIYNGVFNLPQENKEYVLRIQYRNANKKIIYSNLTLNGQEYGSVVLSRTSSNGNDGYDYVEIPIISSSVANEFSLSFGSNSVYIGSIEVVEKEDYTFR